MRWRTSQSLLRCGHRLQGFGLLQERQSKLCKVDGARHEHDDARSCGVDRRQLDSGGHAVNHLDIDVDVVHVLGLGTCNCDVSNRDGLTGGTTRQPFEVAPDVDHVEQHALQR
jgi:hypothetical protein